jgi:predicted lipoprotein with Yx(FWY)xxD motif
MNKQWGMGFSALALAAALAGCGGTPGTTGPSTGSPPTVSSAPAPGATTTAAADVELKTASSTAGQIVVDAEGKSVYFFTKDVKDSGTSACKDACVAAWPAVTTNSDAPKVDGVTGAIGTINAADGSKQITINGMPIYYFAKDKAPGDILGQGVMNVWYLVSPTGDMIKSTAASGY